MPKLPVLKPKEVVKILERAGFLFERQNGSHRIFSKDYFIVTVPIHNKDLKKGTLKHIVKQSGFTVEDFIKFL